MLTQLENLTLLIVLAPLAGAIVAGMFGSKVGRSGAHYTTIGLMAVSFCLAMVVFKQVIFDGAMFNGNLYTWGESGSFIFHVGFLIDPLSAVMMMVVTFVSLLVHIYSIGYMHDDNGYQRFFSYISMFTFAMLMLVTGNNFLQLFFGWEGVGVASYLLIGFWFKRDSANVGSLKAFLVNRVGDLGFILGIAAVLSFCGSIDYATVFAKIPQLAAAANTTLTIWPGFTWPAVTVISLLLFTGAMGKSAQVPLHVWLPESMEGPTPISALIHAATMVTAGVYMVSRMSPIFEYSQTAMSFVLIIGATGALFTGILALVQHDIKRVVAYSTLSQLGYMVAATGASAYAAGMFHLVTHACFKALLFLAAGSVIMGVHHNQDMRTMGNLRKYMPITYITFLFGALSLSAIPPFAGFFSKDAIIEAVQASTIPGSDYAYICVLLGSFITALYTFRAFFLTFHTTDRMDDETRSHVHESPWVVTAPLIVLAVPSLILGAILIGPMLYSTPSLFGSTLKVLPQYNVLGELASEYHGPLAMMAHAVMTLPFWFAIAGIAVAYYVYEVRPTIPAVIVERFPRIYNVLLNKYGFDDFNQVVFVDGGRKVSQALLDYGDIALIDDGIVNGAGRVVQWVSRSARRLQTGYLYHYAFAMIIGLLVLLALFLFA